MTDHFDPPPAGPQRPRLEVARLWAGGAATAVVAALIALVGVLIVRAVLRIAVYAPAEAGAFGDSSTVVLCLVCAAAALAATGLLHLLLVATPAAADLLQLDRRSAHRRGDGAAVHLRAKACPSRSPRRSSTSWWARPSAACCRAPRRTRPAPCTCRRTASTSTSTATEQGDEAGLHARPEFTPESPGLIPLEPFSCRRGPGRAAPGCAGRGPARPARRCRPAPAGTSTAGRRSAAARRRRRRGSR